MKNLMLFVHPSGNFLPEHKTSIKIQIDNSLGLGWKVSDIILATNFPYEYNGVKSILVSGDNYSDISPCVALINVIVELFDRNLIEKGELYWYHDNDAYELYRVSESELNLGSSDMGLVKLVMRQKFSASPIFFKSSAKDIFSFTKEIIIKYRKNEELALNAVVTNNLLWVTGSQFDARTKFVPTGLKGSENIHKRVKELNMTYNLEVDTFGQDYPLVTKPVKVAHFHFTSDLLLDSAMYGKNSLHKVLMPERLIKIFKEHGVKGIFPKKMKNLMIYINPEKRFSGETEELVKRQIDNSLRLSWKKKDIILITNFPYKYKGVKARVLDDRIFWDINEKANNSNVILHLLTEGIVKEAELWWYHDLDVFQIRKVKSSEVDLEDTPAGFMDDGSGKFDTGSFFFRTDFGINESIKVFEWMRNRTCRLNTDEKTAFMSLTATNYRNINSMYKILNITKLTKRKGKPILAGFNH